MSTMNKRCSCSGVTEEGRPLHSKKKIRKMKEEKQKGEIKNVWREMTRSKAKEDNDIVCVSGGKDV